MAGIPKGLGFPTRVAGFPSLIRKELTASRRKVRALRTAAICCARIAEVGHGAAFPLLLRSSHSLHLVHQRIQEERREARHRSVTDCGANGRAFQGCVRFKSLEDLALDVVGRTVARVSAEEHMANYQAARARNVK